MRILISTLIFTLMIFLHSVQSINPRSRRRQQHQELQPGLPPHGMRILGMFYPFQQRDHEAGSELSNPPPRRDQQHQGIWSTPTPMPTPTPTPMPTPTPTPTLYSDDRVEYRNGHPHGMRISGVLYPFQRSADKSKLSNPLLRRDQQHQRLRPTSPPDGVEYLNGRPHGMRILGVLYPFQKSANKSGWPSSVSDGIDGQPYGMRISGVLSPFQQSTDQDVVHQNVNPRDQQLKLVDINNGDLLYHEGEVTGAVHDRKILQVHSVNHDGSLNLLTGLTAIPVSGDLLYRNGNPFAIYQNGFHEYSP